MFCTLARSLLRKGVNLIYKSSQLEMQMNQQPSGEAVHVYLKCAIYSWLLHLSKVLLLTGRLIRPLPLGCWLSWQGYANQQLLFSTFLGVCLHHWPMTSNVFYYSNCDHQPTFCETSVAILHECTDTCNCSVLVSRTTTAAPSTEEFTTNIAVLPLKSLLQTKRLSGRHSTNLTLLSHGNPTTNLTSPTPYSYKAITAPPSADTTRLYWKQWQQRQMSTCS